MLIRYYKKDKLDIIRTAKSYAKFYAPIIGDKVDAIFTHQV